MDPAISNHAGLSAPVPRGRKGRKGKKESTPDTTDMWLETMLKAGLNPDELVTDESYKKHLQRHANKYEKSH